MNYQSKKQEVVSQELKLSAVECFYGSFSACKIFSNGNFIQECLLVINQFTNSTYVYYQEFAGILCQIHFFFLSFIHFSGRRTQPAFTCSKLTIKTLEQGVKYVILLYLLYFIVNFEHISRLVLVFLLLTWNM